MYEWFRFSLAQTLLYITDAITWGDFVAIMKSKMISWMDYTVLATIEFQKLKLSLYSDTVKVP